MKTIIVRFHSQNITRKTDSKDFICREYYKS